MSGVAGIPAARPLTSRREVLRAVRDECMETVRAADVIDDNRVRVAMRVAAIATWQAIEARCRAGGVTL